MNIICFLDVEEIQNPVLLAHCYESSDHWVIKKKLEVLEQPSLLTMVLDMPAVPSNGKCPFPQPLHNGSPRQPCVKVGAASADWTRDHLTSEKSIHSLSSNL